MTTPTVQHPVCTALHSAGSHARDNALQEHTPPRVLVADLFCGAGGSSSGAAKAIASTGGEMELVAVNHWPVAVETHQLNHPTARHYVENLETADPERIVPEGYLDLLMASPECKYYSRAKGGKPIQDQGRMSPWIIQNWLTNLDVRILLVENVPEFTQWGPLIPRTKRPDPKKKGQTFQAWVKSLWDLGYDVDWRLLNAADFGDATTRIRFFLQARNDGLPINWPEATHSKHGETTMYGALPKWRGAREIIDWSNQGRSILDHRKYIKKPLAVNTRRRIAKGLEKFGGPLAYLYIRLLDLTEQENPAFPKKPATHSEQQGAFLLNRHGENGSDRVHPVTEPMPTSTTRGAGYLLELDAEPAQLPGNGKEKKGSHSGNRPAGPFHSSDRQNSNPRSPDEPVYTITGLTGGGLYLVETLAQPFIQANRNHNTAKDMDHPVPTATSAHGGGSCFITPEMVPFILGQHSCSAPREDSEPLPTIAGSGAISLTQAQLRALQPNGQPQQEQGEDEEKETGQIPQPIIIQYFGQSVAQELDQPISTILSARKHALVDTILVHYYGQSDASEVNRPVPTVTTKDRYAIATPTLVDVNHSPNGNEDGDHRVKDPESPLNTITAKRGVGLAEPVLVQANHGNGQMGERGNDRRVHQVDEPIPGITTSPGLALAEPILLQTGQTGGNGHYTKHPGQPVGTITTKNEMAIANPAAEPLQRADNPDGPENPLPEEIMPQPYLVPNFGEAKGQAPRTHDIGDPTPAATSHGAGNIVSPTLEETLLDELESKGIDPRRLVLINGHPWLLDIRFRMLQNNELARAMGFEDEEYKYEFRGTVTQITKQIGNAVPVNLAAALVKAALKDTAKEPDQASA